jgi:hypothetical protein
VSAGAITPRTSQYGVEEPAAAWTVNPVTFTAVTVIFNNFGGDVVNVHDRRFPGYPGFMTNPSSGAGLPLAAAAAARLTEQETAENESEPTVGASDAEADAARSGADADLTDATHDSDGVPVGEADLEEDKRRSGA